MITDLHDNIGTEGALLVHDLGSRLDEHIIRELGSNTGPRLYDDLESFLFPSNVEGLAAVIFCARKARSLRQYIARYANSSGSQTVAKVIKVY